MCALVCAWIAFIRYEKVERTDARLLARTQKQMRKGKKTSANIIKECETATPCDQPPASIHQIIIFNRISCLNGFESTIKWRLLFRINEYKWSRNDLHFVCACKPSSIWCSTTKNRMKMKKSYDVYSVFYDLIYSSLADHACTLSFNRSSECAYKKLTHIDSRTIEAENRATPSLCHRLWKYTQKKDMTWNSNELEHWIWSQKGITFDVSLTFQFIAMLIITINTWNMNCQKDSLGIDRYFISSCP